LGSRIDIYSVYWGMVIIFISSSSTSLVFRSISSFAIIRRPIFLLWFVELILWWGLSILFIWDRIWILVHIFHVFIFIIFNKFLVIAVILKTWCLLVQFSTNSILLYILWLYATILTKLCIFMLVLILLLLLKMARHLFRKIWYF